MLGDLNCAEELEITWHSLRHIRRQLSLLIEGLVKYGRRDGRLALWRHVFVKEQLSEILVLRTFDDLCLSKAFC